MSAASQLSEAGGYETFTSTTTYATRQKMQVRWKDALKRAFELAKFDPRHKEDEKPKLLKKPRFIKVSAIKPEQKGLNLQLKVVKLLVCQLSASCLPVVCQFSARARLRGAHCSCMRQLFYLLLYL